MRIPAHQNSPWVNIGTCKTGRPFGLIASFEFVEQKTIGLWSQPHLTAASRKQGETKEDPVLTCNERRAAQSSHVAAEWNSGKTQREGTDHEQVMQRYFMQQSLDWK
mmetsp:Transcript_15372/g.33266  ORF Transcript_15372/g.33266 Transcript_15372/m.33266 type:complete len:107 (-) Transcript_15372:3937-4257(-)